MNTEHPDDTCQRLEEHIRPYVLALLRIIVATYERERRDDAVQRAMLWERPTVHKPTTLAEGWRRIPRHQEEHRVSSDDVC